MGCFTWSVAGRAASPWRRRRWPTTSGCTTCSFARRSTPRAPSTTPLAASEHGRFVLVSSKQGQDPDGTNAAYGATKAAAESWTLALADSFRQAESAATANIIVINAILSQRMRDENPDKPYRSFTSTDDIAEAIAFLCSDAGAKINGKRLPLHPLR